MSIIMVAGLTKYPYQRSLNLIKVFATLAMLMATQRLKLKIRSSSTLFRSWNLLIIPLSCILAACNIQSVPINLHSVSCLIILWIVFVRSLHTHYISRRLHFFQSFPDNWPSQATKLLALSRQSLSSLKEDKICALTKFGKNEDKNQTSRNSTRVQVEADGRFQPPVFPRDHFVDRNTLQCVLKRSSLYE